MPIVNQHSEMFAFQVSWIFRLDVNVENLLLNILGRTRKTQIKSTRAEKLRDFHVCGCDTIFGHTACWLVERKIATRRHLYVECLFVVCTANDDIA